MSWLDKQVLHAALFGLNNSSQNKFFHENYCGVHSCSQSATTTTTTSAFACGKTAIVGKEEPKEVRQ